MLAWLLNPAIIRLATLFVAILWMLRDHKDRTRPLLVIALVFNLAYGWVLSFLMGKENSLVPWKYDYVLLWLDRSLGLPSARFAAALHGAVVPLFIVYQLMVPMMIVWVIIAQRARKLEAIALAYVTEMIAGPILYAVVPACGPVYAFHKLWLTPPPVAADVIRLSGMPNAFPSLHIASAVTLVFFSPTRRVRTLSLVFFVLTAMATIVIGEHYVIDLIAGLAFGSFAAAIGRRRISAALWFGGITLGWSVAVRWANGFLIEHPWVLRGCAVLTIAAAIAAVAETWRQTQPARDPELAAVLEIAE